MGILDTVNEKTTSYSVKIQLMLISLLASSAVLAEEGGGTLLGSNGSKGTYADSMGASNAKGSFIGGGEDGIAAAESSMTNLTKVAIAVFTFVGFCLAGFGIYTLYKSSKQNSQASPMSGFVALLAGSALAILPWIVFTSSNTIANFAGDGASDE